MNVGILLATSVAGGVGAALRYLIDRALTPAGRDGFPGGILFVNGTGSLALGLLTGCGALLAPDIAVIVGVGLLGGYTTFSTVHVETVLLARRRWRSAVLNLLGTLALTVCAAGIGLAGGTWVASVIGAH